jgi:hypothetical protein
LYFLSELEFFARQGCLNRAKRLADHHVQHASLPSSSPKIPTPSPILPDTSSLASSCLRTLTEHIRLSQWQTEPLTFCSLGEVIPPLITAEQTFSAMHSPSGITSFCIVRRTREIMTKVRPCPHCHWPLRPKPPDPLRQNPIASVLKQENPPRHGIPKPILTPSSDLLEIRRQPACTSHPLQKTWVLGLQISPMHLFCTSYLNS